MTATFVVFECKWLSNLKIEVGMSFSVMVNFLGLGILVLFVPKLTLALDNGKPNTSHAPSYILIFFRYVSRVPQSYVLALRRLQCAECCGFHSGISACKSSALHIQLVADADRKQVPETNHKSLEGMQTICMFSKKMNLSVRMLINYLVVGESTRERALRHIHSVRSSSNSDERDGVAMQLVQRPDEEG